MYALGKRTELLLIVLMSLWSICLPKKKRKGVPIIVIRNGKNKMKEIGKNIVIK